MAWWIWLLIGLGLLLIIGLIVFFIVRSQQKPPQTTLIRRTPQETTLIKTGEAPAFDPVAVRAAYQAELARRKATGAEQRRTLNPQRIQ